MRGRMRRRDLRPENVDCKIEMLRFDKGMIWLLLMSVLAPTAVVSCRCLGTARLMNITLACGSIIEVILGGVPPFRQIGMMTDLDCLESKDAQETYTWMIPTMRKCRPCNDCSPICPQSRPGAHIPSVTSVISPFNAPFVAGISKPRSDRQGMQRID